jgi:signal transduction histidine kinase
MQTRMSDQRPQRGSLQGHSPDPVVLPPWLRSTWFGYVAALLLIAVAVLLDRGYDYISSSVSMFDAAPFGLVSIVVALLWGLLPALFALALGLFALAIFVAPPELMISDIGYNIAIFGPFVFLQILAVATAIRFEADRRRIAAAQQTTRTYAQELETANQRLLQANEQLERANYLKDYVILRSSHEIRTPMTVILAQTQMALRRLKRSGETAENWSALRQYLEIVESQALDLRMLIDDLFELSSLRTGQFPLRLTQVDLASLCRDVIKNQQAISDRAIELELPSESLLLQADQKRLAQVLVNLVNNAIKYSPEYTAIHVSAYPEHDHLIVEVHNEGTALSPEELEHIFEPFYRTCNAENSPVEGWGLGLTISQEIVELHKGQIWAESAEGKGITFFVKLPLNQDNPA